MEIMFNETSFKKTDTGKHIAGIARTEEETPVWRKEEKADKGVVAGTFRRGTRKANQPAKAEGYPTTKRRTILCYKRRTDGGTAEVAR